jgi:hypothetical protein
MTFRRAHSILLLGIIGFAAAVAAVTLLLMWDWIWVRPYLIGLMGLCVATSLVFAVAQLVVATRAVGPGKTKSVLRGWWIGLIINPGIALLLLVALAFLPGVDPAAHEKPFFHFHI